MSHSLLETRLVTFAYCIYIARYFQIISMKRDVSTSGWEGAQEVRRVTEEINADNVDSRYVSPVKFTFGRGFEFVMDSQQQRNVTEKDRGFHHSEPQDLSEDNICVDIFVAEHCFVCEYAHEIAELIESDFADVKLRVIDINKTEESIPDAVFATPTYLLNGRVWSLGNPSPEQVRERLTELLKN